MDDKRADMPRTRRAHPLDTVCEGRRHEVWKPIRMFRAQELAEVWIFFGIRKKGKNLDECRICPVLRYPAESLEGPRQCGKVLRGKRKI